MFVHALTERIQYGSHISIAIGPGRGKGHILSQRHQLLLWVFPAHQGCHLFRQRIETAGNGFFPKSLRGQKARTFKNPEIPAKIR